MTRAEHLRQQLQRVDAYKAWLHAGSTGPMPCLPSSADFKAWKRFHAAAASRSAATAARSMAALSETVKAGNVALAEFADAVRSRPS